MFDKELHDCLYRYVQSCLNPPCVTNTLIARNYVESDMEELKKEEEDEKSISLGMPIDGNKSVTTLGLQVQSVVASFFSPQG